MRVLGALLGLVLLAAVASDAFEVMLLPRRVRRQLRPVRFYFRGSWAVWAFFAGRIRRSRTRDALLSFYGPLSMVLLLTLWAFGLVLSFALLHWVVRGGAGTFWNALYLSGSTFFTLGYGDVVPNNRWDKTLAIIESGSGLGYIAATIGYLPVLYQLFSKRETRVIQLDPRAGSPPAASTLLCRHSEAEAVDELFSLLKDWEEWSAELVESHLSYPMLSYYRSQHDNQSWLAGLTCILDSSAILVTGIRGVKTFQPKMTFAVGRLAAVELCRVFHLRPKGLPQTRLPLRDFKLLAQDLTDSGLQFSDAETAEERLAALRATYEPFLAALSNHLLLNLAPWRSEAEADNWHQSRGGTKARELVETAPVHPD
ncbi:MAG: potassium channel family protein [Bryobacteraceae bacterium]